VFLLKNEEGIVSISNNSSFFVVIFTENKQRIIMVYRGIACIQENSIINSVITLNIYHDHKVYECRALQDCVNCHKSCKHHQLTLRLHTTNTSAHIFYVVE
jgi:hypothetical protein